MKKRKRSGCLMDIQIVICVFLTLAARVAMTKEPLVQFNS